MPIKPPNLDDRRYADLVREARALIPQYCPDWTNLSDSDPGVTLVQLFSWMTEMTIFRLNRVPDKTYVHFLNFIGEERREARPAQVPVTFSLRTESRGIVELPAFTRCSTKQAGGVDALHFLTLQPISVHSAQLERVVSVKAGERPMVREVPFQVDEDVPSVVLFGGGSGTQLFRMDPVEHGPNAFTAEQFLYVAHDDFRMMDADAKDRNPTPQGRVRLRTASEENLPVGNLFRWERYTVPDGWQPIETELEPDEVLGLPELSLKALLPRLQPVNHFGNEDDPFLLPELVEADQHWIRGVVEYERWLAARMQDDLEITWRDDRGGEERLISNWDVRDMGRSLEFFVQDMPPVRAGWTVRMTLVDRSLPAGRNAYFPKYRFSYRRGELWETLEADRVRYQGTSILIAGPFSDMATDGYNLRAERIETVNLRALVPELELEATWVRPVVTHLAMGPESNAAAYLDTHSLPQLPFQIATTLPPLLGMKFFVGSDVFENRAQRPVLLEVEIGFEYDGNLVEDPKDLYHLQLSYRAADTWRVVHTEDGKYSEFTFATLDPEGALQPIRRKIRFLIDPKEQLKGLFRSVIAGRETCWLRFEMTRAALTKQPDKREAPKPVSLKVFNVKLGVDGIIGKTVYEQPMPGLKTATVEYRANNRRLTRAIVRSMGRLSEHFPFDRFIDLEEDPSPTGEKNGHTALYVKLDRPLPAGERHAFLFKCRGETYLPEGTQVFWEHLEPAPHGKVRWRRLGATEEAGSQVYRMNRSGVLEFRHEDPIPVGDDGVWLRALFRMPDPETIPTLPPLSHLLLNSVDGINLHEFRMEKFSGEGIPNQSVTLRRSPVYLHPEETDGGFTTARFSDIRVYVTEEDGERREWRRAPGNSLLTASKDDRVFVVEPIDGQIAFGNGIRGKILPVGSYNVSVDMYHVVPGEAGNVAPGKITVCEGFGDMVLVTNKLPATGGRNPETIEEIVRRAPSVLTSRDRAITRLDFEVIAREASAEVARAACDGRMTHDGEVEVVLLPQRREGEVVPDPFLAAGLQEHVQRYLARRCLVNVRPTVRLASFQEVDVSLVVRLRPNANFMLVREHARTWVRRFLDPYAGGLDGQGWPFGGTLYAQDFARMVTDIAEVRHVVEVHVYEIGGAANAAASAGRSESAPGWQRGMGQQTLLLDKSDLFVLRHVRVVSEEGEA
ncbi:MAG: baseplate J/gp47 family protein [Deltaproteobacteria bacterium]|nr:baseplate J/gp47 family protein [Deltaproteobacteria bacterium]